MLQQLLKINYAEFIGFERIRGGKLTVVRAEVCVYPIASFMSKLYVASAPA